MNGHTLGMNGLVRAVDSRSAWAMLVAGLLGAFLLMIAARSVMSHPPMYDELLHVLSARGVMATGEPAIVEGVYRRSELFTRVVAWFFEWRGESLWAARLPALLSGMALVLLTGAWVTRHAGFVAGAAASIVLAVTATSIELSAFARFYTLHALCVFIMYIAAFEACAPAVSWRARGLWSLLAIAVVSLAWNLQPTTIIAVGSVILGVGAVIAVERWREITALSKHRLGVLLLAAIGLAIFAAWLAWHYGIFELARTAPHWAAARSDNFEYYNRKLGQEWPLFWTMFPLAAAAAIAGYRRLGLFCAVAALSAIAVHSVSAAKAVRYIYYAIPLLCAVIGCGIAVGVKLLAAWVGQWRQDSPAGWATLPVIVLVLAMAANSQEARGAVRFLTGKATWLDLGTFANESDWQPAMPALRAHLGNVSAVVVSSAVKGVYHLGDYDYELNASTVYETDTAQEFGLDLRTGRRAIGSRDSLAKVLDASASTLIVIDSDKLGAATGVADDVVALINARCGELAVPEESRIHAWICRRS